MDAKPPAPVPAPQTAMAESGPLRCVLPSGRGVTVRVDGRGEAIEIRSPGGEVELCIALTAQGPVLTVRGARLEIDAADTVAVNCRQFELRTAEGIVLDADGDLALRSRA